MAKDGHVVFAISGNLRKRFEIGLRVVAQRADEVIRHIRAVVHIAADGAHKADALFREMLDIPENYKIFYIGGGASTFFY